VHPTDICPDCEVLRTERSKHCAICNRCVERYDHHCPWINNCVGINNHTPFLVFIVTLIMILMLIILSSIVMLANDCRPDKDPVDVRLNCPLIEFCVGCRNVPLRIIMLTVTSLIAIFFVLPGTYLCHVHVKNFTSGKTTNERFSRAA
jgi:palmitoyltransferase